MNDDEAAQWYEDPEHRKPVGPPHWRNARPMSEAPQEVQDSFKEFQEKLRRGEVQLDFSRFHPLDHRPWECWARNRREPIYGKTRTHLRYWWMYKRPGAWQ